MPKRFITCLIAKMPKDFDMVKLCTLSMRIGALRKN